MTITIFQEIRWYRNKGQYTSNNPNMIRSNTCSLETEESS